MLMPTAVMPLNVLVNERRLYLALVGFSWLCGYLLARRKDRLLWALPPLLALLTLIRNPVWVDELSLWMDAARKAPAHVSSADQLGP